MIWDRNGSQNGPGSLPKQVQKTVGHWDGPECWPEAPGSLREAILDPPGTHLGPKMQKSWFYCSKTIIFADLSKQSVSYAQFRLSIFELFTKNQCFTAVKPSFLMFSAAPGRAPSSGMCTLLGAPDHLGPTSGLESQISCFFQQKNATQREAKRRQAKQSNAKRSKITQNMGPVFSNVF